MYETYPNLESLRYTFVRVARRLLIEEFAVSESGRRGRNYVVGAEGSGEHRRLAE